MLLEFLPSKLVFPPHSPPLNLKIQSHHTDCLGFLVRRKALLSRVTHFPVRPRAARHVYCNSWRINTSPSTVCRWQCLCAEPDPPNYQDGAGASSDQAVAHGDHLQPNARDKDAVRYRVLSEHRLSKPPEYLKLYFNYRVGIISLTSECGLNFRVRRKKQRKGPPNWDGLSSCTYNPIR